MTNENKADRLREMKRRGWKLMPCLTAKCIGDDSDTKLSSLAKIPSSKLPPISQLQQLVAEMAVATESQKSVLNIASTFWNIIQHLHVKGKDGIAWLLIDP